MKVYYPEIKNNSRNDYQYSSNGNHHYAPSFSGANSSNSIKKINLNLKRLADYMRNASEVTNAAIAAIGTGIIAPFIILVSPGKGDKEDKDKKFFQAIRQPLSAILALSFQLPATIGINKLFDKLAYEKKVKLFKEDNFGDLIPGKRYIESKVTKEEIEELAKTFDVKNNAGKSLHDELIEKTKNEYKEVGLELSDEEIEKIINKKNKRNNFLRDKIVKIKHNDEINKKIEELKNSSFEIKDSQLVSEELKNLAEHLNKEEYKQIEKNANLSFLDKTLRIMGFENKKLKALKEAQNKFKTEKGIEILKEKEPDAFAAKIEKYVTYMDEKSQKLFKNKKFWLSLVINLFMVSASCYALNWAHPRFKELIDKYSGKDKDKHGHHEKPQNRIEVRA